MLIYVVKIQDIHFSVKLHRKILDTYFGFFFSGPTFRKNEFLKIASRTRPEPIVVQSVFMQLDFQKFISPKRRPTKEKAEIFRYSFTEKFVMSKSE